MTTTPETWLSVPEAAEALGVAQRDVRNMLADRRILAVRRGEAAALAISSLTLVDEGGKAAVLPSLRGTLTALSDAGCSDEEAWRWLTAANGELGERPIDALRAGRVHAVRRAAATLAF
ncbi:Rv2175c family DNA-binding protein [Peptidiphaga gingivicola]|uniref:Rv2175c family DNA-binding protein n=1 Tax=Peptidiphaga gingivicola TaxID=2741497 RepID=UPI001E5D292D|nr:Rv2175c family DNA-binding protein [Peptidiphaga gingivicola]